MVPAKIERLPWREIDGRSVIIHPKRGEVHELNAVGTMLWQLADGSRTLSEIADAMTEHFDVQSTEALADAKDFFQSLEDHGLIQWRS